MAGPADGRGSLGSSNLPLEPLPDVPSRPRSGLRHLRFAHPSEPSPSASSAGAGLLRRFGQGVVLLTLATLLAGCGKVAVDDPAPDPAGAAVCTSVLADLPEQVLDQERRTVEPGRFSAAWGKPAIVLRCGVPAPPMLTPTSECLEVNGVGWFSEEATGGMIFTTIGRAAYVEVSVPSAYQLGSGALVDVGAAVATHDPVVRPCQ